MGSAVNVVELRAPCLLVAVPKMADPNFRYSVIALLEHSDEGSFGLVLSQPSELTFSEFCSSHEITYRGGIEDKVHVGGPVQQERAFLLHQGADESGPETETVLDGLNLSYSMESLRMLATLPPPRMRMYVGYAGWGAGQLGLEVVEGSWLVAPIEHDLVFLNQEAPLWEVVLERMGIHPSMLQHSGVLN